MSDYATAFARVIRGGNECRTDREGFERLTFA